MADTGHIQDIILDSIADGVFTVDRNWAITSFNRAAEHITGVPREEAIGQKCCDIFRASICEADCALRKTMTSGTPVVNQTIFIVNPDGRRIPISISTALLKDEAGEVIGGVETFRDLSAVEELRRELEKRYSFQDIVSKNPEMLRIFSILPSVAESDTTVLIEGDSGTGKELIARAIHNLSPRSDLPMITINCGALPDTLLESELFGYKAGAFTDARKDKPGRFAMAKGGTIFLDEIADVSPALQVRLLRVLQEHTYEPLGSTDSVTADVRVIAAANRNLETLMKQGSFREDLYYRINVMKLSLPPLADRREDIPLLANHFVSRFNKRRGKAISGVSPDVLRVLMTYHYPGNIRELENIIEHAFVLCHGATIELTCLPPYLHPSQTAVHPPANNLAEYERNLVLDALKRNGWNRTRTAEDLGIHKATLWRKMKRLEIDPAPKK